MCPAWPLVEIRRYHHISSQLSSRNEKQVSNNEQQGKSGKLYSIVGLLAASSISPIWAIVRPIGTPRRQLVAAFQTLQRRTSKTVNRHWGAPKGSNDRFGNSGSFAFRRDYICIKLCWRPLFRFATTRKRRSFLSLVVVHRFSSSILES